MFREKVFCLIVLKKIITLEHPNINDLMDNVSSSSVFLISFTHTQKCYILSQFACYLCASLKGNTCQKLVNEKYLLQSCFSSFFKVCPV